jgi:hypothetical protein
MFIGHFGVAFASKRLAPETSLGTLFLAAQFLDGLWPVLLLAGLETVRIVPGNTRFTPLEFVSYPISHSLLFVLVWAGLFVLIYGGVRRYRAGALVVGALVLSHWVLDSIAHRPDLPLFPGGPRVGLGLWNSVSGTLIVEGALFAGGLAVYLRATVAKNRTGSLALWGFVAVLLLIYCLNLGPPPPSPRAVAWAGMAAWLFVPWAYWIDRHRTPRVPGGGGLDSYLATDDVRRMDKG